MSNAAFVCALRRGDAEAARRMVEQGAADTNMMVEILRGDLYPNTTIYMRDARISIPALHAAIVFKEVGVVELLLEKQSAHVNVRMETTKGETPLTLALERSLFQLADVLLQGGADPNMTNHWGKSPLEYCCCAAGAHYIPTLLRCGACIEGNEKAEKTPLHVAGGIDGDLQSATILVKHGANVNACNDLGRSPIFSSSPDIMQMLLTNGAQVNLQDHGGWTPLHSWAFCDFVCCELLLSNHATVDVVTQSGSTPLHFVVAKEKFDIVCLLLTHQRSRQGRDGLASLLLKTRHGDCNRNVLHRARSAKTARFLVEQCRGEDGILLAACHQLMFAKDDGGHTPRDVASKEHGGREETVEYLDSFTNLTLATNAAADDDDDGVVLAAVLNPRLDEFQRTIATDCLDLVRSCCLEVPDDALYLMLGYVSPSDVMKR